jgi:site-specific recombinase XerD
MDACAGPPVTALRNRALLAVLYRSGLRISEALDLRPKDVDSAGGALRVMRGKGVSRGSNGRSAASSAHNLLIAAYSRSVHRAARRRAVSCSARSVRSLSMSPARRSRREYWPGRRSSATMPSL